MNSRNNPTKKTVTQVREIQPLAVMIALVAMVVGLLQASASEPIPQLEIKANEVAAHVSPLLYGLMTEEINYSYDGGLYAELVSNRIFKESPREPLYWSLVQDGGGKGSMSLDTNQPVNEALTVSLKLEVTQAEGKQRVGIANGGFWGIPVRPETRYRASFFAKAAAGFTGPLTMAMVGDSNGTVYASAKVPRLTEKWQRYQVTLTTGNVRASKENHP